jgi:ubiquinone biosynthesis protein COQ9
MSKADVQNIQDKILLRALDDVAFDGWSLEVVENAAAQEGFEADTVRAVFPGGLSDVLAHFSDYADRMMLQRLEALDSAELRIRDRIQMAVIGRFEALEPYKEAVRLSLPYWARPFSQLRGGKIVWRSADVIWNWAGDTSQDYNYYTKRTLLSGILVSSTPVWLNDKDENLQKTRNFVERRIGNVMQFGKIIGRIKK